MEEVGDVQSFIGVWEKYVFKKPCQIEGCGHIISGIYNTKTGEWDTCGESAGAAIVYDNKPPKEGQTKFEHYMICVCCLSSLDEVWRAKNGDPD